MQRIADHLRHSAVMGEHNICHAREILIEQRSEDAGFQRLHKRGETGDVGKKGCNLAALPDEVDGIRVAGKLLDKVRREVARQRGIGPFGRRLMMIGTSGRAALALGNSSRPLIPGILMSDRIRMSDRSPASVMR